MTIDTEARATKSQQQQWIKRDFPAIFHEKYTQQDKADLAVILDFLNENKKGATWLGAAANVNRSTMHLLITGEYSGNVSKYMRQLLQTVKHIESRKNIRDTPFIPSSVTKLVWSCCQRARKYRNFSIFTAEVGLGKTRAINEYVKENEHSILIEATPMMTAGWLLDELSILLKIDHPKSGLTREKKLRAILQRLEGTNTLLILDEAETVQGATLEHLRRIRDIANVGIFLTGTPRLHALISPVGGHFDQIRSRVGFWPNPVRQITKQDARAVITASFADVGEVDEATLKAFWHHARGSMRMIVEDLIPAVRDYGLKKHPLSGDLVHAVAKDVLSLH